MQIVAISGWQAATPELVQGLAGVLGISVYEARQRLIGNGPAVVAGFGEAEPARVLARELRRLGFAAVTVDSGPVRGAADRFRVRRFRFRGEALLAESQTGKLAEIRFDRVELLLPATSIVEAVETRTSTERKLSIGKTLMTGGIPMTSKAEIVEKLVSEERGKILFLYAGRQPPAVFGQNDLVYDGFGESMKLSRELNFAQLLGELRRLCTGAIYDELLLNRLAQVRLLGPTLEPEANLELAAEILARSLLRGKTEAD